MAGLLPSYAPKGKSVGTCLTLAAMAAGSLSQALGADDNLKAQFTLRGHKEWVSAVAFSPDGKTLASAGPHIKLWDPATGKELATWESENTSQNFIRYSTDGETLFAARGDGELQWFLEGGKHFLWLKNPTGATNIAVSPRDEVLAVIMNSKDIDFWRPGEPDQPMVIEGGAKDTTAILSRGAIQFSPDGKLLATGHTKGKIKLWNVDERRLQRTIDAYKPGYNVTSLAFSPDGQSLAAGASRDDIKTSPETELTLWNVETGELTASYSGNKDGVTDVAFSPDGRTLASAGHDSTIRLWDVANRKPRATLKGHTKSVMAIAFSPDGRLLASGSGDRMVRVWKVPAEKSE
jgi:WD40 repeat protein